MSPQQPEAEQQPETHRQPQTRSEPPQYSRTRIVAVWAAAVVPTGAGAWLIAPALAGSHSGSRFSETLIAVMTAGLVW